MLKYRLRTTDINSVGTQEITLNREDLTVTTDGKYVSGSFDSVYNVKDGDTVRILTPFINSPVDVTLECENVIRTGYFEYLENFQIQTVEEKKEAGEDKDGELLQLSTYEYNASNMTWNKLSETVSFEDVDYKIYTKRYVQMPNGNIYYEQYTDSSYEYYTIADREGNIIFQNENGYFDLDIYECLDENGDTIIDDTTSLTEIYSYIKYYVDDDTVTFKNEEFSFSENYITQTNIDDEYLYLDLYTEDGTNYQLTNWHHYIPNRHITKFIAEAPDNIEIDFSQCLPAKKIFYILYKGKEYDLFFDKGYWKVTVPIVTTTQIEEDICGCKSIQTVSATSATTYVVNKDRDRLTYQYTNDIDGYPTAIEIEGGRVPILSDYRVSSEGDYLFIYLNQNYTFSTDSIIQASVSSSQDINLPIYLNKDGKYYVIYKGTRILLEDDPSIETVTKGGCTTQEVVGKWRYTICKYKALEVDSTEVDDAILGYEFEVQMTVSECQKFLNGESTFRVYQEDEYGNKTEWEIEHNGDGERYIAKKVGTIVYSDADGTLHSDLISSTVTLYGYKFNFYRCLTIDKREFYANLSNNIYQYYSSKTDSIYQIEMTNMPLEYNLNVMGTNGATLICRPQVDTLDYYGTNGVKEGDDVDLVPHIADEPYKSVISRITTDGAVFFYFKDTTFGNPIQPNVENNGDITILSENSLEIYKLMNYVSFPIHLFGKCEHNLFQELAINNQFIDEEADKAINPIVDMERDIYFPVILGDDNADGSRNFQDVYTIKFNLHFRTRDLENNWKIIDGVYGTVTENNWNIIDKYSIYKDNKEIPADAVASSDLAYFLNFTEDDVFYQKSKIGKSFLRLSFYDSTDSNSQNLLHTSTIFLDENLLYSKYIKHIDANKTNENTYKPYDNLEDIKHNAYCSVNTEPVDNVTSTTINYNSDRLEASFSVSSRDNSDTSSEGYYLYMFKDYGTKLRPSPIFMKVEFNHAGEGKTLTFLMPTIPSNSDNTGFTSMVEDISSYEITDELQDDRLTLFSLGTPLNKISAYQYIRFEAQYDEKNHRYVYYVPKTFMKANSWQNNTMTFNLWELKIKDES